MPALRYPERVTIVIFIIIIAERLQLLDIGVPQGSLQSGPVLIRFSACLGGDPVLENALVLVINNISYFSL